MTIDARDKFRIQFTISTAFCLVTALAILCAVARWERAVPYWTIIPAAFFVAGSVVAKRGQSPDLAWGLISIGWVIALIAAVNSLIDSFAILGGPLPASEMQARFWRAYGSVVALPLFLTIPAVYLAARASIHTHSRARKWIIACAVIAFGDCTLATVSLVTLVGYTWPW